MAANTAAWLEGRAIAQPTSGRRERVDVPSFASLPRPTVPDPDPGALAFSTAAVTMLTPRRARTGGGLKEAALADEQHVPPEGGERAPRPPAPTSGKDRSQAIIELYRPHFPRRPVQEMRQIMSNYPGQDEPKPKQLPPQTQFQPPPQPQPQPQPPPQPQAQAWQNLAPAKVPEPAQKTAPVGGAAAELYSTQPEPPPEPQPALGRLPQPEPEQQPAPQRQPELGASLPQPGPEPDPQAEIAPQRLTWTPIPEPEREPEPQPDLLGGGDDEDDPFAFLQQAVMPKIVNQVCTELVVARPDHHLSIH
jgi:hypothetical protein